MDSTVQVGSKLTRVELQALQVLRGLLDLAELLVPVDQREQLALQERVESRDRRVTRDRSDHRVYKVLKEYRVLSDHKEPRDHKVATVQAELQVHLERVELLVLQGLQVLAVRAELQDLVVRAEQAVSMARVDLLALPELQVLVGQPGLRALLELRAASDRKVLKDP